MLQVLVEHRGEMLPKVVGFKPLEIPPIPQQIEDIVCDIARYNLARAVVLRAYYCGRGRRGVDRFEAANELAKTHNLSPLARSRYYVEGDLGVAEVRGGW